MFDFLKKKLFKTADNLEEKVSKEAEEEKNIEKETEKVKAEETNTIEDEKNTTDEEEAITNDKKPSFFDKLLGKKEKDKKEDIPEEKSEKSSFFSFIKEKTISEKDLEDILWELEMSLLESDVAMEVSESMIETMKENLVGKKIKRSSDVQEYTIEALKKSITKVLDVPGKTMTELLEEKKEKGEPLITMFVGINGTGKTTTIAKVAKYYMDKGYTPVIAASDTFRAGAIEQLTLHADNLGVKIIKHQKGSDPAAIAFDAIEHAKSKGKELVLIDTAGRMQTNTNLMDEMKKIKRVAKPDLIIFVGDALTGNDAVEQSTKFNEAIDISGVILTKTDADSKGGSALSIGHVINKPIFFLGMGQEYTDLIEFDPEWMVEQIFGE